MLFFQHILSVISVSESWFSETFLFFTGEWGCRTVFNISISFHIGVNHLTFYRKIIWHAVKVSTQSTYLVTVFFIHFDLSTKQTDISSQNDFQNDNMITHNKRKQNFNLLNKDSFYWGKCNQFAKFFMQFLWVLEFPKRGTVSVKSCSVHWFGQWKTPQMLFCRVCKGTSNIDNCFMQSLCWNVSQHWAN